MSKTALEEEFFIQNGKISKDSIIDYSNSLSNLAKIKLTEQAKSLPCHIKVLILPKDYSPEGNFDHFCKILANKWHVQGDRFLMIIDLKGHHVRGLSGSELVDKGLDSECISKIMSEKFVPFIKNNDLEKGIKHVFLSINNQLYKESVLSSNKDSQASDKTSLIISKVPEIESNYTGSTNSHGINLWALVVYCLIIIAIFMAIVFYANKKKRNLDSQKLFQYIEKKLTDLYAKANQIAQAAEYLNPQDNEKLAQKLAIFFNNLGSISAAQQDLENINRNGKLTNSHDSLLKIKSMLKLLESESSTLLQEVNSATGAIESAASLTERANQKFMEDVNAAVEKEKIRENEETIERAKKTQKFDKTNSTNIYEERFNRPTWSNDTIYCQPVYFEQPGAGLSNFLILANQMQLSNELHQMRDSNMFSAWHSNNYVQEQNNYSDRNFTDSTDDTDWNDNDIGGSDWGSDDSSSDWGGGDSGGSDW